MTAALDIIIPVLAAASILTAVLFVLRALRFRARADRATFGVAQHEARQAMLVDIVRSIAAAFVGLILLGTIGLGSGPAESEPQVTATRTKPVATAVTPSQPAATLPPAATSEQASSTPEASSTLRRATATPEPSATFTPVPSETPKSEPVTATVSSGVGVWLRSIPSTEGDQLEWVLDGTTLALLPGKETADDLEWQQVRTPDGNEGWVAAEFLIYNE